MSWRAFVSFLVIATPVWSHETTIVNGGFETGALVPWFHRDNDPLNPHVWSISSQAHSGLFGATVYGNEEIRQNFAPIPTTSITELSFWVRHSTAPCLMYVELYGTGGGRQVIVTTTQWEKYDVTSWLTPGTFLTGFSIYGFSLNDTYLDDVVLVPEPSMVTLIGAACVLYALHLAWKLRKTRNQNQLGGPKSRL